MRVVIDTNVFISAAMRESSLPGIAVELVVTKHQLLMSEAANIELFRVLAKPHLARLISPRFVMWLSEVVSKAEIVIISESISECRHAADDKFLELAVNGHADVIVSGDNDLLVLHPFRGIPIFTPASFLAWVS